MSSNNDDDDSTTGSGKSLVTKAKKIVTEKPWVRYAIAFVLGVIVGLVF